MTIDQLLGFLVFSLIVGLGMRFQLAREKRAANKAALEELNQKIKDSKDKTGPWGVGIYGKYPRYYAVLKRGDTLCPEYGMYELSKDDMELLRALARCHVGSNEDYTLNYKDLPISRKQQGLVVKAVKQDSEFWGTTRLPQLKKRIDDILWILKCSVEEQKKRGMRTDHLAYYKK